MNKIKVIAVMGDSHTWGEGVGAEYGFNPPPVGADKRMAPFTYPNYVNLLRNALSLLTDATAEEYCGEKLRAVCGGMEGQYGVLSTEKEATVCAPFSLCRLFVKAGETPVRLTVRLDGETVGEYTLRCADPSPAVSVSPLSFRPAGDGESHRLTLSVNASGLLLHRVELYDGSFALVNAGIGSCPVGQYMDSFFDAYVKALNPYAVILEGNTINDWLAGETPEEYGVLLTRALQASLALTPRVYAHTVMPVGGDQTFGGARRPFAEFVEEARKTILRCGVPLSDSGRQIADELSCIPTEKRDKFLYHDIWHPNATGHYFYARSLIPALKDIVKN